MALHTAVERENIEIIRLLLRHDEVNVNAKSVFMNIHIVKYITIKLYSKLNFLRSF